MDIPQNLTGLGGPAPQGSGAAPRQSTATAAMGMGGNGQDPTSIGRQPASPEEQAQYEKVVAMGAAMVLNHDTADSLVRGMRGDPLAGVSKAAAAITMRIVQQARKQGEVIGEDVAFAASHEILGEVMDLAKAEGIMDFDANEGAMQAAVIRTAGDLQGMMQDAGLLDAASAEQGLRELRQADQDPRLLEMVKKPPAAGGARKPSRQQRRRAARRKRKDAKTQSDSA